jgi:adenine-specific DNA-methyltransferase
MAKIEDLIAQIPDERLRKSIAGEIKALKKTKKFGLVFEEHLPETVRLPRLPVREGELVSLKREPGNQLWRVRAIRKGLATCDKAVGGYPPPSDSKEYPVAELVVVRNFGDPIYPALVPVDRVSRGGPEKPWHVLINADNFHALQLLFYCYEGKVDVIYIDPPYNTGARDWKYNNNYVDKTDTFRHSKWLSMMKRRLLLAKRLLKPDGVLIVTIDENEVHHLRCLLSSMFNESAIQQTTIVVNPKGVTQGRFSRVEEFGIFAFGPDAMPTGRADDYLTPEPDEGFEAVAGTRPRWKGLLRSGTNARREDRGNMFYPVLVNPKRRAVVATGDPLPLDLEPKLEAKINGLTAVWPIRTTGALGNWGVGHSTLRQLISKGYVSVGEYDPKRKTYALSYLSQQLREQIESGILEVVSFDRTRNLVDVKYAGLGARRIKTVWKRSRHDAGVHGSEMVKNLLGRTEAFSFPKSLYAVEDTVFPFVRMKKDALILDFFSGSGTTFHATALMNARDGGCRRCISVTNNEVSEERHKQLTINGWFAGDEAYEMHGIANAVTWPRCKAAVEGKCADGSKLQGAYLGVSDAGAALAMLNGFEENIEYFRLDFLDPAQVARGDAFQAIQPILWMMSGCSGEREDSKGSQSWFIPKHSPFAVLIKEKEFRVFCEKCEERKDIKWVFLVTDSEENFATMRRTLGRKYECVQLYKSYLENFRLNTQETLI